MGEIAIKIKGTAYKVPNGEQDATLEFWQRVNAYAVRGEERPDLLIHALTGAPLAHIREATNLAEIDVLISVVCQWVVPWMTKVKNAKAPDSVAGYSLRPWTDCTLAQRMLWDALDSKAPDYVCRCLAIFLSPSKHGDQWEAKLPEVEAELLKAPASEALPAFFFCITNALNLKGFGRIFARRLTAKRIARLSAMTERIFLRRSAS